MAVTVVDFLEMVDIDDQHAEAGPDPFGADQFAAGDLGPEGRVEQGCLRVGPGGGLELGQQQTQLEGERGGHEHGE